MKLERNIAYLVEEDRATVGKFEAANALPNGARKRALLVTEQLAFKQAGRNSSTVYLYQGVFAAGAQIVNGAGD